MAAIALSSPSLARALAAAQETRCLEVGRDLLGRVPEVFRRFFTGRPAIIVADKNTFRAAGRAVQEAFTQAALPCREPFVFTDPDLYAEHAFLVSLEEVLKSTSAIPVAVGSGTINDLAKLAAHRTGRPYMAVATAASMDGYTAFGASITYRGSKQTFTCPAPMAVVADLEVIRSAPRGMNASGYADLLAKTTAGADWLLADALGVEALQPKAWDIVQGSLRAALANPAGVASGDFQALAQLTEGLMLGGFAMQSARSSRAASGAEHQFSHLWDMQHHTHEGKAPSHGFKVGIGTLASAALYEYLLAHPLDQLDIAACCDRWPDAASLEDQTRRRFEEGDLRGIAFAESRAKWVDVSALRARLQTLRRVWPGLRDKLHQQLIPFAQLKQMLGAAGAPAEPEQIGISRARLREGFQQAYFIRRRFTVLDLAVMTGLLEQALEELFGGRGPWPAETP